MDLASGTKLNSVIAGGSGGAEGFSGTGWDEDIGILRISVNDSGVIASCAGFISRWLSTGWHVAVQHNLGDHAPRDDHRVLYGFHSEDTSASIMNEIFG